MAVRTRPDDWGVAARLRAVASGVALLVLVAAWPSIEAHARAGALLAQAVLRLPIAPATWVTPSPVTEEFRWDGGGVGVLTLPGTAPPYPVLLLVLGAEPEEPDGPAVLALRDALARVGLASLIVRSEPLIDGRVTPDEVPLLVRGFVALEGDARVERERVGMLGLSTGGSLAIVAAADPEIAERVWLVFAMGAYNDAATLAAEVTSGSYRGPAGIEPWTPDETSVRVVRETLLAALPASEQESIVAGLPPRSEDGRAIADLLDGGMLDKAEALLRTLSPPVAARMAALSPSAHLRGLRAPLYLLHDRGDPFIPATHTLAIAREHEPRTLHIVDLFMHVEPKPASVGVLLRDGWKLLRVFAEIIGSR